MRTTDPQQPNGAMVFSCGLLGMAAGGPSGNRGPAPESHAEVVSVPATAALIEVAARLPPWPAGPPSPGR